MSMLARPTSIRRRARHRADEIWVIDRRATASAPSPAPASPPRFAEESQDEAMYGCACGFQFAASVSTSVGCPHCGALQAW